MTEQELDWALSGLDPGLSSGLHKDTLSRIAELDAVREQYRQQVRTARRLWVAGLGAGLAAVGIALLRARQPEWDLGAALAVIPSAELRQCASAAALAATAALFAFDSPEGGSFRR